MLTGSSLDRRESVSELKPTWTAISWPNDSQALCRLLLHQQCWCWGQDVRQGEGNLLLAHGFERVRPPLGTQGSSRYQLRISSRSAITLWGFGLYYSRCGRGGIYLNRYDCVPRFCHHSGFLDGVWTPDAVPTMRPAASVGIPDSNLTYLAGKAACWIASYEEWVLDRFGLAYRQNTLRNWHEPSVLPELVPEEWRRFGSLVRVGPRKDASSGTTFERQEQPQ